MKKYYLSNDDLGLSKLSTYNPYGNILNWNSFSIEEYEVYNLKKYVSNFIEIDQEMAIFGFRSFGEKRHRYWNHWENTWRDQCNQST